MTKIQELAQKRQELAKLTAKRSEAHEKLFQTPEAVAYNAIADMVSEMSKEVEQLVSEYKWQCITDYISSGNKEQPGGKIKVFSILRYDESDAVNWSIEHNHPNALKIDKKKFEALAKVDEPDFVKFLEDPRMYLDSDLSQFLLEEGEN